MRRKMISILLTLCMILSILPITALADEIAWLDFDKKLVTMNLGETMQLKFTATGGTPSFLSSNAKVASVDANGMVTALKTGSVDIRGYVGEQRRGTNCTVVIKNDKPVTSLVVPEKLTLDIGESYQLDVKLLPQGAKTADKFIYTVNDSGSGSVTVDKNGKITAVKGPFNGAVIGITLGNVKARCVVNVNPPEGYVSENPCKPLGGVADGWYTIRCMYNFLRITSDGSAELRWQNPAQTFYVKNYKIDGKNRQTIQTAEGKYLGLGSNVKSGAKVKTQTEPYYWVTMPSYELFSVWVPGDGYLMMNASGESNKDGTPIIIWDNKSTIEPFHGKFMFTPAKGPEKENVPPQVVAPTTTNPLKLKECAVRGSSAVVFGLTLGKTTVSEMKALYGEPDDFWMNTYEQGGEEVSHMEPYTYWYAYVNNWKDLMLVATENDTVMGVYTNASVDFGKNAKQVKGVYRTILRDEGNKKAPFGTWIRVSSTIAGGPYVSDGGEGDKFGAFDRMFYYTLNGFLASKEWKMLYLNELGSFNLFKEAYNRRASHKSYQRVDATRIDGVGAMYEAWEYLYYALENKSFRASLWEGKYNSISIGYAEMWPGEIAGEVDRDTVMGSLIVKLGNMKKPI